MKICTKCQHKKHKSDFYVDKTKKDFLSSHCKKCRIISNNNWFNNNIERAKESHKIYRETHKESRKEYDKAYHKRNKHKFISAKLKNYGITIADYQKLLDIQQNKCAICTMPETAIDKRTGKPRALSVDHNHNTGEIRGLLCGKCNTALGLLKEDVNLIKSMVVYISKERR